MKSDQNSLALGELQMVVSCCKKTIIGVRQLTLKDLDAELLRIRDHRSRVYFSEALRAYRSGAYRAATSATWVALVFDILLKYRELSAVGDAEAVSFIEKWDKAIAANNVGKLMKLERSLLEHARDKMSLINHQEHRLLQRLYEDRHLCAHPAFASEDRLFEPTDELVRTHLTAIVEFVLSQRPVQGRRIFELFCLDLQSPGFPSDEEKAIQFVENKYLGSMREEILKNFGVILAKSLIRNVPPEWQNFRIRVVNSLNALRLRRPESWPLVLAEVSKLVNNDDPEHRLRCLALLADVSELIGLTEEPVIAALQETASSDPNLVDDPVAFAAVSMPQFRDNLVGRFEGLSADDAEEVLSEVAASEFWPNALERFADSGSFRSAEANFDRFVRPFTEKLDEQMLSQLFEVTVKNRQIWDSGGIPAMLAETLKLTKPKVPSFKAADDLYSSLSPRVRARFAETWELLSEAGWEEPQDQEESED